MHGIKFIRERLGVTQASMAEGIGCTQGNVGHYESRGQTVPPETAKRLISWARGLGHVVTYEDIYGPAEAPTDTSTQQAAGQGVVNA